MTNILYSSIILINAVLAGYQAFAVWHIKGRPTNIKLMTCLLSASSCIWSLGFGVMFLLTDFDFAADCRAFGLIGVFLFLNTALLLIGSFSTVPKQLRYFFYSFSMLGYVLFPFIAERSQMSFSLSGERWISFAIVNSTANNLYSLFCILITLFTLVFVINIIRSPIRRNHLLGLRMLALCVLMFLGMLLDTVFPMYGFKYFPGSTITQFWGVTVILAALRDLDDSQVTISNMSNFVYSSISIPVIIYTADFEPVIVNDASYDFLESSRSQTPVSSFDTYTLFGLYGNELMDPGSPRDVFTTICLPNEASCKVTIDTIRDKFSDVIGYIMIINDITEQMEAMANLEDAKAVAEESNRSKSIFLANVSHELRTPMNSIIGFSELLLGSDMPAEDKDYVHDILTSSRSLLDIVNDVLDISKIESGSMELVPDNFAAAELFKQLFPQIESLISAKDLVFKSDIAGDIPSVLYGDSKRIREIITNLISNAIKYTAKGYVSLKASCSADEAGIAKDSTVTLHISVKDTGSGIREEDLSTIFDTFTQVDKNIHYAVEGSGLGLAITKSYVGLMNGSIRVESVYGEGSCFFVDIPLRVVDPKPIGSLTEKAPQKEAAASDHPVFTGLRILVVDDSKINLKVMSNTLRVYGIEADCVQSGPESIDACVNGEYDLVFMDQMMPDMDGEEAMLRIRELGGRYARGGECLIVAFTANAVKGVSDELIEKGFDTYMSKPFDKKLLEEMLADASERLSH